MLYPSLSFRSSSTWTPAEITTALWLDAADASTVTTVSGAVSQWDDKSGNGRNATQIAAGNRPAYTSGGLNSLNVLTLDGTDDWLSLPDTTNPTGSNAVFAVYVPQLTGVSGGIIARAYYWGSWYLTTGNTGTSIRYNIGRAGIDEAIATVTGLTNNLAVLATGTYDKTNVSVSANGNSFVNTAYTPDITYDSRDLTTIGAFRSTAGIASAFKGLIAEIVVLHSAPSQTVIEKMQGYLAHKWGLAGNLPVGHPYKNKAP